MCKLSRPTVLPIGGHARRKHLSCASTDHIVTSSATKQSLLFSIAQSCSRSRIVRRQLLRNAAAVAARAATAGC